MPKKKRPIVHVHLRMEPEVINFFKMNGKGHITKMQNILTLFVRKMKEKEAERLEEGQDN